MRKISIIILTILASQILCAQEIKKVKNFNDRARTSEIYYVLKDNNEVRHGKYLFKYNGVVQVQGQFENNSAAGKWVYTPGKGFRIEGNYSNGKKNGTWKYYKDDKLISEINYNDGILEVLYSYSVLNHFR